MLARGFFMAAVGDYFRSRCVPTHVRVRAYSAPPPLGHLLATLEPGTYFGPVEAVNQTDLFITVLVRGFWMNVAKRHRSGTYLTWFAFKVSDAEIEVWERKGWQHVS